MGGEKQVTQATACHLEELNIRAVQSLVGVLGSGTDIGAPFQGSWDIRSGGSARGAQLPPSDGDKRNLCRCRQRR